MSEANETHNVADEFSELCDALRAKYSMPDGDWKALLDKGMALYARLPEGAPSEEAVARAATDSALTAFNVVRLDLGPIFGALEAQLRDAVPEDVEAGSEEEKRAIAAAGGADGMGSARQVFLQRIDTWLDNIGTRGTPSADVIHVVEAATARLEARVAAGSWRVSDLACAVMNRTGEIDS